MISTIAILGGGQAGAQAIDTLRREVVAPALSSIKHANHENPHLIFDLETLGLSVHAT